MKIYLVTCDESWEEIDKNGHTVMKTSRHAWISSEPINRKNVHGAAAFGGKASAAAVGGLAGHVVDTAIVNRLTR